MSINYRDLAASLDDVITFVFSLLPKDCNGKTITVDWTADIGKATSLELGVITRRVDAVFPTFKAHLDHATKKITFTIPNDFDLDKAKQAAAVNVPRAQKAAGDAQPSPKKHHSHRHVRRVHKQPGHLRQPVVNPKAGPAANGIATDTASEHERHHVNRTERKILVPQYLKVHDNIRRAGHMVLDPGMSIVDHGPLGAHHHTVYLHNKFGKHHFILSKKGLGMAKEKLTPETHTHAPKESAVKNTDQSSALEAFNKKHGGHHYYENRGDDIATHHHHNTVSDGKKTSQLTIKRGDKLVPHAVSSNEAGGHSFSHYNAEGLHTGNRVFPRNEWESVKGKMHLHKPHDTAGLSTKGGHHLTGVYEQEKPVRLVTTSKEGRRQSTTMRKGDKIVIHKPGEGVSHYTVSHHRPGHVNPYSKTDLVSHHLMKEGSVNKLAKRLTKTEHTPTATPKKDTARAMPEVHNYTFTHTKPLKLISRNSASGKHVESTVNKGDKLTVNKHPTLSGVSQVHHHHANGTTTHNVGGQTVQRIHSHMKAHSDSASEAETHKRGPYEQHIHKGDRKIKIRKYRSHYDGKSETPKFKAAEHATINPGDTVTRLSHPWGKNGKLTHILVTRDHPTDDTKYGKWQEHTVLSSSYNKLKSRLEPTDKHRAYHSATDTARADVASEHGALPLDHDAYTKEEKRPNYNVKISPVHPAAGYNEKGRMLRQRLPEHSKDEHVKAGDHHSRKAHDTGKEKNDLITHSLKKLGEQGKDPGPAISGIHSEHFDDATKDKLRHLGRQHSMHSHAAFAHYAAAGKRYETARQRYKDGPKPHRDVAYHDNDDHAIGDLHSYSLNHAPIKNAFDFTKRHLEKKAKKGVYNPEKAAKAWGNFVEGAARAYHKEHHMSGQWHHTFPAHVRRKVAERIEKAERPEGVKHEGKSDHARVLGKDSYTWHEFKGAKAKLLRFKRGKSEQTYRLAPGDHYGIRHANSDPTKVRVVLRKHGLNKVFSLSLKHGAGLLTRSKRRTSPKVMRRTDQHKRRAA